MAFTLDIDKQDAQNALGHLKSALQSIQIAMSYVGEILIHTESATEDIERDVELLGELLDNTERREQEEKDKAEFEQLNPDIPGIEGGGESDDTKGL